MLRSAQKLLAILVGALFGYWGYRLFIMGVTGQFDFKGEIKGFKGQLVSGSPGLFFALLGAFIILSVIMKGETTEETTVSAGSSGHDDGSISHISRSKTYRKVAKKRAMRRPSRRSGHRRKPR